MAKTMAELHIKRLRADHPDADRLLAAYFDELSARLGGFDPARSVGAAPEEMTPPNGAFLVLYENGTPVACGGIKSLGPEVGEIKRMFVSAAARGRGHGRRLLAELEEAARSLGYRRVVLDTAAPLEEAAALYASAGYREIEPYNENFYAARWFGKEL
jgi:GNAT superfamily N-acetyltransferase